MEICKIYDFEYVTQTHMQFVKAWATKESFFHIEEQIL